MAKQKRKTEDEVRAEVQAKLGAFLSGLTGPETELLADAFEDAFEQVVKTAVVVKGTGGAGDSHAYYCMDIDFEAAFAYLAEP